MQSIKSTFHTLTTSATEPIRLAFKQLIFMRAAVFTTQDPISGKTHSIVVGILPVVLLALVLVLGLMLYNLTASCIRLINK